MRADYLLFHLAVAAPPALVAWRSARRGADWRWRDTGRSILWMAFPFLAWDAWAADRHWHFNGAHLLGPRIAGLPIEEVLFFFTVPFACLFSWQSIFARWPERRWARLRALYLLPWALAPVAAALFLAGPQYTGLTLGALCAVCVWDRISGSLLLEQPRFLAFLATVLLLTAAFDGYLTARPVVLYAPEYHLGLRLGTIPVEDFGYGVALVYGVVVGFERVRRRGWLARAVERLFGGYRHRIDSADEGAPRDLATPRAVAVVGAGVAGLRAAATLAERGYAVTLFEANSHLGGKIGAWRTRLPDGSEPVVEHGFHAFFPHYYNLNAFLQEVGADRYLVPIDDYLILAHDGTRLSFGGIACVPLLNLLSMARHGVYRIRDLAGRAAGEEMAAFFRYDPEETFAAFDGVSFQEFADRAELPPRLRLVFTTFARAFFADADRLSMAELIKAFHSYYLCHDHGLLYRYPANDYDTALIQPIRRHLERRDVQLRLDHPVERLGRTAVGFEVGGADFDAVVLAAPARASREILERCEWLAAEDPELRERLPALVCGQRYAVLRLWLDRDISQALPVFAATERIRLLDSITSLHRVTVESADWARAHGGAVLELHCYALPDDVVHDDDVRAGLLQDLYRYHPELTGAEVRHEVLQVRDDFTAFHVGLASRRPGVRTAAPGLVLAGDWVRLPCPAMLMEAACTSGLLAANVLLRRDGLREARVESVPLRGLLAARPAARGRRTPGRRGTPRARRGPDPLVRSGVDGIGVHRT